MDDSKLLQESNLTNGRTGQPYRRYRQGRQSWGVGGLRPPDFGQLGRGRVVKYYYILSCTGSMFKSGDF